MKIRLDRVVDEPLDWQTTLTFEVAELGHEDIVAVGDVDCRGRLTPTPPDILLQASLSYVQTLRCNRCLESFEMPMSSEIGLILQIRETPKATQEVRLEEKDLGFLELNEPEIDLRSLVNEQLQLGLPMKPLCREDCAGLCGRCGADLNHGPCDCRPDVDPRWAMLKNLK